MYKKEEIKGNNITDRSHRERMAGENKKLHRSHTLLQLNAINRKTAACRCLMPETKVEKRLNSTRREETN
jgi:hypothetical protein